MDKKSAIMQMYYMERGNCETIPVDEKCKKLLCDVYEKRQSLIALADESSELGKSIVEYLKLTDLLQDLTNDAYFEEGFKFGFLMCKDILEK